MPRAGQSQPLYADDSDPESEKATSKQTKALRKRLSDVHDVSFADSPPRLKRQANDDTAEKRRRRKSTKIAVIDNAEAGPSGDALVERDAADTSRKQRQPLNSVAAPVVEPPVLEILSSNFDEWMKMATDNKINAGNSWNFDLINYFHDMSLLKNDDGMSINFQRASCTLDGCVKIWTSRVDSVGTETGKLLSNLANDGNDEDEDGNGSDNPDEETTTKKKKSHRPAATLAKEPGQLRSKKLDLEFSVDPLFRKTCADFDEGGAQGLLMNHLSLGIGRQNNLRVIFDSGDAAVDVDEVDDEQEPEDLIDLTEMRKSFFPDLQVLETKAIAHSLADFSFDKSASNVGNETTFFQDDTHHFDDDDENDGGSPAFAMDDDNGGPVDFFAGDDAVHDDLDGHLGGDDFGNDHQSQGSGLADEQRAEGPMGVMPFDPRRPSNDFVLAEGEDGAMEYFNDSLAKNWAGPEHWKKRKPMRRLDAAETAAKQPRARKERKEPPKIDFFKHLDKDLKQLTEELFASGGKNAGINLAGTKGKKKGKEKEKKKDHHLLPDDIHFSSRQLASLFLKPKFQLKMRGRKVRYNADGEEVDENFWAQAAADQAAGRQANDDDDSGAPAPFTTQFFNDDYDDGPGFDDFDGDGDGPAAPEADAGESDLLAEMQGATRRAKPQFVNYAKRAKRVDVRKLKDNIWKGLDITIAKSTEDPESMVVDEPPPTNPSEARVFSSVISGLQRSYPKDKMEEISTSFCFICLLHLANEQGLKIETGSEGNVPDAGTNKVGDLWDLKVFRDPNATQAA